jgi:hypothetical protein
VPYYILRDVPNFGGEREIAEKKLTSEKPATMSPVARDDTPTFEWIIGPCGPGTGSHQRRSSLPKPKTKAPPLPFVVSALSVQAKDQGPPCSLLFLLCRSKTKLPHLPQITITMQHFLSWYDHIDQFMVARPHLHHAEQLQVLRGLIHQPFHFLQYLRVTNPEEEAFLFLRLADLYRMSGEISGSMSDVNHEQDCLHRFRDLLLQYFGR